MVYRMKYEELNDWVKNKAQPGDIAYYFDRRTEQNYLYSYKGPDDNPYWRLVFNEVINKYLVEEKIIKILNKIRPYLNSEGGDLQYIGFEDGIVYVRMMGACVDCAGLDSTLKDGIEALLVESVPEVIEVRNCGIEEEIDVIGDYE